MPMLTPGGGLWIPPPGLLARRALLAKPAIIRARGLSLPDAAAELRGRLSPDWSRAHWLRLPAGNWVRIIPAIFTPAPHNGGQVSGGTGTTRTLTGYTVSSGAIKLIAHGWVWHSSTTRTISGITFDSVAMSQVVTNSFTGDGNHRSSLYHLSSPNINTADVVMTINASGSGQSSGIEACWVDGISSSAAEATAAPAGDLHTDPTDIEGSIDTVSDGAIVFVGSSFWAASSSFSDIDEMTTFVVGSANNSKNGRLGYGVTASAGTHTFGWHTTGGEPSWCMVLASFAAAAAGGSVGVVSQPAWRRQPLITW